MNTNMAEQKKILYKRTSTGATQMWWVELDGGRYRTFSGQLNGAITTTEWTVCKGKNIGRSNETTPEQQAAAEVESAYELKRKKGYRETVEEAQNSDRFQCMLAEHYKQKPKEMPASYARRMSKVYDANGNAMVPLYVQPKLDGIRCIANKNGLWSREGNPIVAVPHIFEQVQPLFEENPYLVLDGELYNHELKYDFNKIVSLVKKVKPTPEDLARSAEMVQYWVYDALDGDKSIFSERFVSHYGDADMMSSYYVIVPTYEALTREEVEALYDSFLAEGYEGGMLRQDVPYEHKRTYSLLKIKEKMDAEFEIIRFEEGVGNAAGQAKIAYMRIDIDGVEDEFKADICGTREECQEYLRNAAKLVGKQATIEFQNYTPAGKPRFPKLKVAHLTGRW